MKTTLFRALLSSGSLALLAGCSSGPKVVTDTAPGVNLSDYEDFAFLPQGESAARNTRLGPTSIRGIETTVEAELKLKGYAMADPRTADMLVAYHTEADERIDGTGLGYTTRHWETTHVQSPGLVSGVLGGSGGTMRTTTWETGYDHDVRRYSESTFIVDVIDARTRQLIWRGWARRDGDLADLSTDDLREGIRTVLKEFPSR